MITADTNVFFYASDVRDPNKQATAEAVTRQLAVRRSPIGLQVIGELQNSLRRKLRVPTRLAAQTSYDLLMGFETFSYSRTAVERAVAELATGRMAYWDALLLASAQEAGCTVLLSEDMQDGRRWSGVEIVNPFGPSGLSERARELLEL